MTRGYYPNLKQMPWKRVSERKKETTTKIIHRKPCFRGAWTHWKKSERIFFTRSAPAPEIMYSYNPIIRI